MTIANLIRLRFPVVAIRSDLGPTDPGLGPVIDVFCVPDEQLRVFKDFVHGELRDHIASEGGTMPVVVTHTVSETREHYPEVYARSAPRPRSRARTTRRRR